ncbi:hypothetical protein MKQ70_16945 [Chitinophaga sedimenti]|nr:hypothetical protein [Chitinophaga sedimenti]MCK7556614.1 hypothetical protein [Chitinophaga sedimenti]
MIRIKSIYAFALVTALGIGCKGDTASGQGPSGPGKPQDRSDVEVWMTKPDRLALFAKQTTALNFKDTSNAWPTITIDTTQRYQEIDGFGYTLTGGSATLINGLPETTKAALLKELFATDSTFIGVSYLRVSIGASDLSAASFTYDDVPDGQTDVNLTQFSIDKEKADLIPVLKKYWH